MYACAEYTTEIDSRLGVGTYFGIHEYFVTKVLKWMQQLDSLLRTLSHIGGPWKRSVNLNNIALFKVSLLFIIILFLGVMNNLFHIHGQHFLCVLNLRTLYTLKSKSCSYFPGMRRKANNGMYDKHKWIDGEWNMKTLWDWLKIARNGESWQPMFLKKTVLNNFLIIIM